MAYDPYNTRLTTLEEKHDRLKEEIRFNQDLQESILTQLQMMNMHLEEITGMRLSVQEVKEESRGGL